MSQNVFFTADTHFGHKKILELGAGRPFDSADEMDKALIDVWNEVIRPGDRVYHLGDFCLSPRSRCEQVFKALRGEKHLVLGNHDAGHVGKLGWQSVSTLRTLKVGTSRMVLCHYPLLTWDGAQKETIMLHGHCHGSLMKTGRRVDVGVDCWDYRLASLEEVQRFAQDMSYEAVDHHV